MAGISERPNTFFRLSPAERAQASAFGLKRGEITSTRFDVNYWRLSALVETRLQKATYTLQPLGQLVSLVQYGSSQLATSEPVGVRVLRMNNLQPNGWDLRDIKWVNLSESELDTYRLRPGDLLFNRTNSKELVGKCDVFREQGRWVFASYLIRVRTNPSLLNNQFACDFLNAPIGRLQIDQLSRQIIGMTNINAEEIKTIRLPLPTLPRQEELVAAMDKARAELRTRLADADKFIDSLDRYLLDILDLAEPPEDKHPAFAVRVGDLAKRVDAYSNQSRFRKLLTYIHNSRYRVASVGQLATRIFSGTTPLSKGDAYVTPPNGVRFIRSGEITDDGEVMKSSEVHISEVVHNGVMKRSQLEAGDLLIAIVGATIGAAGVFTSSEPANINQAIAAVRLPVGDISAEYVCLYLRSSFGQALLDYFKRPVARANINLEEVAEIPLIVPPKPVQETVVKEYHRRREKAQQLRAEAERGWEAAKQLFEEQLLGAPPQ